MTSKPFRHTGPVRTTPAQQGIVLLTVLWILVLLAVIVGQFCYSMRTELNITRNLRDETTGYYLARAGINLAILKIIDGTVAEIYNPTGKDELPEQIWRVNREIPPIPFAGGVIQVKIDNESGKININGADKPLLQMLIGSFGLPWEQEATIVESILDWRDFDDLHHVYGAENDYYLSLPQPYSANNGPLKSIEELLLVKGVTHDLWEMGLKHLVTVQSDVELDSPDLTELDHEDREKLKISINAAPPEVLKCFPGMTPEVIQKVIEYRHKQDFKAISQFRSLVGETIYKKMDAYITIQDSTYYRIRATGTPAGAQSGRSIEIMVRFDPRLKTVQVISWVDYVDTGATGSHTGELPASGNN